MLLFCFILSSQIFSISLVVGGATRIVWGLKSSWTAVPVSELARRGIFGLHEPLAWCWTTTCTYIMFPFHVLVYTEHSLLFILHTNSKHTSSSKATLIGTKVPNSKIMAHNKNSMLPVSTTWRFVFIMVIMVIVCFFLFKKETLDMEYICRPHEILILLYIIYVYHMILCMFLFFKEGNCGHSEYIMIRLFKLPGVWIKVNSWTHTSFHCYRISQKIKFSACFFIGSAPENDVNP